MSRRLPLYCSAVALATITTFAQQPATPPEVQPETTLTGCLRSSGADTAVAGPSGRIYTLDVVEPPKAQPSATTTPGTTAAAAAATVTSYSLDAPESLGLGKHADHQVQLTGRLQAPSTTTTRPATPGTAAASPTTDRKPTPGGGHRTFHVSALKMIAAKCAS